MKKILITGATGNVGTEVLKALGKLSHTFEIIAGSRNIEEDKIKLSGYTISFIPFDFTDTTSYKTALSNCDVLFLLRPPQIDAVKKYFKPLIDTAKQCQVQHIVFLSVQGVEKSTIIPHHKIEQLIIASGIPFTFLRPAYFMQNFSTTLHSDLVNKKLIFLPAGNAKFTMVDITDIGLVAGNILTNTRQHINTAYELTTDEKLTFKEMAQILSEGLGTTITYYSPNLLHFFLVKRKEKIPIVMILVMIMLHYFPRFQQELAIRDCIFKLTGKQPVSFKEFIAANKNSLLKE